MRAGVSHLLLTVFEMKQRLLKIEKKESKSHQPELGRLATDFGTNFLNRFVKWLVLTHTLKVP